MIRMVRGKMGISTGSFVLILPLKLIILLSTGCCDAERLMPQY